MGVKIAPDVLVKNPEFFSTGFPLAYPVGWSMEIFGHGLLQARIVMVLFALLLVLFFYLLARKIWNFKTAALASFLLVSFASLYGNGKNVLGEVPGLFFLILFLYFVYKIEQANYQGGYLNYVMAGLAGGLCIATKSIFLVLPPALILGIILFHKRIVWSWRLILAGVISGGAVMALLLKTQFFGGGPLINVIRDFANPYAVNTTSLVFQNITRFFTEMTPFYLLLMILFWLAAIIIRCFKKEKISLVELISLFFVLFICASYLRMVGWYRYLFAGQVISLLFFPASFIIVFNWLKNKFAWSRGFGLKIPIFLLIILIGLQFYQLIFRSWVAGYYNNHWTADLENYFSRQDTSTSFFVYNAPEIVTFLPTDNYCQYLKINDAMILGQEQLAKIQSGVPDKIIINNKEASAAVNFSFYQEKAAVSRYLIFERK
jgi:4-amino-4-deoxy-L-arabinose transferase-like glycosyltransferase